MINIFAPIEAPSPELIEKASFTRCVTATLAHSLEAAHSVIEKLENQQDISIVNEAVGQGVSANLLDALIGLSGEENTRDVHISIIPSASEKYEAGIACAYGFHAESIQHLVRASEYLKDNYVVPNARIEGFVKKLARLPNEEAGTVTIEALIGGKERSISFELKAEEYLVAIHAHESRSAIEYFGDVYINSRSARLINGRDLRVRGTLNLF